MPCFIGDIDISQISESQKMVRRNEADIEELYSSIQQKGLLELLIF
jgi:hypothetical protein